MSKRLEKWYPYSLGVAVAAIFYACLRNVSLPDDRLREVLSAIINVSAIAVGFLATAKSILFSIENRRSVRHLKQAGEFKSLVQYLMAGINWSFWLGLLSVAGIFIKYDATSMAHQFLATAWIFCLVTAGLCYYRVVHVFSTLLAASD